MQTTVVACAACRGNPGDRAVNSAFELGGRLQRGGGISLSLMDSGGG